ncbi:hypothetical protein scyTo_0002134 [Scyliorhinus torazame]|uniref:Uncharacterized protein n=1 Tax=Scyliorhinus torazame TaxID=75743 RepID=A0A401PHY2_SCYTO|nr:hypothetical protein [Scyliorhinus torazame]
MTPSKELMGNLRHTLGETVPLVLYISTKCWTGSSSECWGKEPSLELFEFGFGGYLKRWVENQLRKRPIPEHFIRACR